MQTINLDENLILQMAAGNRDAFRELYIVTSSTVYGFALSILRSRQDAEDVMHDAFLKMYGSASTYTPSGKPLAWILTIVRNLSYNRLRDSSSTGSLDDDFEQEDAHDLIGDTESRIVLDAALKVLDESEREIVILHAVTGYKHREIADMLDMPQGTVLSKYKRALGKLKGVLGDTMEDTIEIETGKEDAE